MKAKLKGLKTWKTIDSSKCIVELLKAVRDLCFQSSRTKVHTVTNELRAIRKLLCTQQRNLDAASYTKMMKENLNVVKSLGGTLVCKAMVTYELESNPTYSAYDYPTYLALEGTTKVAINHAVEQRALAALIIEGSDTDSSNLRQVLADNYALHQNNYPTTSVEALDMVVAFKDSKKPTKSRGNNRTRPTTGHSETGKQRDPRKKREEQVNQGSTLLAQQGNESTNLPTDQHSRQLLMTAVESGETFTPSQQTTYMFLNIGMISHECPETEGSSLSSSSISTYESEDTTTSYDGIPNLVPQTHQEEEEVSKHHYENHR
eukprot:jgi/Psemu1/44823/gm1.44823_g